MEKPIIFSRPQTARMRETLTKTMENIELKKIQKQKEEKQKEQKQKTILRNAKA